MWTLGKKIYFIKNSFWKIYEVRSIDTDSGPHGYVLWCSGSRSQDFFYFYSDWLRPYCGFLEIGNLYGSFFFKFQISRFPETAKNCYQVIKKEAEGGSKIWGAIPNRFLFLLFSIPSKSEGPWPPLAPLILAALHDFSNFFKKKSFAIAVVYLGKIKANMWGQ